MADQHPKSTKSDPLIEEVRSLREAVFAAHQHDAAKVAAHLKTIEERYRSRMIRRTPKDSLGAA